MSALSFEKKRNVCYDTKCSPETEDSIVKLVDHQDIIYTASLLDILHKKGGIVSDFQFGDSVGQHGEINLWPDYFMVILHNYEGLSRTENTVSPFDSFLYFMLHKNVQCCGQRIGN